MYQPFDSMPNHSRLWIYQANRLFSPTEKVQLDEGLKKLCEQWTAHQVPLCTSYLIQDNLFVMLAVDEQQEGASGCSIDSSVHFLKGLMHSLNLDFFDRSQVAFLADNRIVLHPISKLKTLFEDRTLTGETFTFNTLAITKSEWMETGRIRVKDSWLNKYLPKTAVAS
ncbi:MAG TPA: hypothetical protein PLR06_13320 [Cyclobacteriaceae bacterium]|nr:hypothetical protein [Cyclobacteriaceae bacterium]